MLTALPLPQETPRFVFKTTSLTELHLDHNRLTTVPQKFTKARPSPNSAIGLHVANASCVTCVLCGYGTAVPAQASAAEQQQDTRGAP
jgi:hypothetical protein